MLRIHSFVAALTVMAAGATGIGGTYFYLKQQQIVSCESSVTLPGSGSMGNFLDRDPLPMTGGKRY